MQQKYKKEQQEIISKLVLGSQNITKFSVVPISRISDYKMVKCLTSIVYIPISIAETIYNDISLVLQKIESDHYYYPPSTMHITIKNIRTIHNPPLFTDDDIKKCESVFSETVPNYHTFDFHLEEVVPFSTSVSVIGYSNENHKNLVQELDQKLREVGVPDNKKYISNSVFFGNITICRFTSSPSEKFIKKLKEIRYLLNETMLVDNVSLIDCDTLCSKESLRVHGSYLLAEKPTFR